MQNYTGGNMCHEKVDSIYKYIEEVQSLIGNVEDDTVVVYRGENEKYITHCQPNLFRNGYFKNNKFFEKNLLDEMKSNRLTNSSSYLETAVDAQHGGVPSRLLDVTYNSLVALYFAVTPDRKKEESSNDKKDGYVYIYFIKNLFCPSANNINDIFDTIINRKKEWIYNNSIFQRNHKLIDHVKMNNRIIAQQGAFILFQGDEVYSIQESDYKTIIIDKSARKKIREDLRMLFGIHTGYIYPEIDNLVKDIQSKSNKISNIEFSLSNELNLVKNNLIRQIEYFKTLVVDNTRDVCKENNESINKIIKIIMNIEKTIYCYKMDLKELYNELKISDSNSIDLEVVDEIIDMYNVIINDFIEYISYFLNDLDIDIDVDNLKIDRMNLI